MVAWLELLEVCWHLAQTAFAARVGGLVAEQVPGQVPGQVPEPQQASLPAGVVDRERELVRVLAMARLQAAKEKGALTREPVRVRVEPAVAGAEQWVGAAGPEQGLEQALALALVAVAVAVAVAGAVAGAELGRVLAGPEQAGAGQGLEGTPELDAAEFGAAQAQGSRSEQTG